MTEAPLSTVMCTNNKTAAHLVVQPVQVIQAVGHAGQEVGTQVLLVRQSGQVAVGWVDIR